MKEEVKFSSIPVVDREEQLKAVADYSEKTMVKRPYTESEIDDFSREVVTFLNQIEEVEEEIEEKISPLKDKIKELKLKAKEFQLKVRNGYEVNEVQVYGFKDFEEMVVNYYNAEGTFVYSRRLQPAEKQATIFKLGNGTEG